MSGQSDRHHYKQQYQSKISSNKLGNEWVFITYDKLAKLSILKNLSNINVKTYWGLNKLMDWGWWGQYPLKWIVQHRLYNEGHASRCELNGEYFSRQRHNPAILKLPLRWTSWCWRFRWIMYMRDFFGNGGWVCSCWCGRESPDDSLGCKRYIVRGSKGDE